MGHPGWRLVLNARGGRDGRDTATRDDGDGGECDDDGDDDGDDDDDGRSRTRVREREREAWTGRWARTRDRGGATRGGG